MVEYGMFFDSKAGDRAYDADAFRAWCQKFFINGVAREESGILGLAVSPAGGRNIEVSAGAAHINGALKRVSDPIVLTVPNNPSSTSQAVYNVVAEYNANRDVRDIVIKVDDPATTAKSPTRDEFVWQLVLARITCSASSGSSAIVAGNISDTRGNSTLCPEMACSVQEADIDAIAASLKEYLTELEARMVTEYKTRMQDVYPKIDNSVFSLLEALQSALARIDELRKRADRTSTDVDALEEHVAKQIEAAESMQPMPSAVYMGNNLNTISFTPEEMAAVKALQISFSDSIEVMPTNMGTGGVSPTPSQVTKSGLYMTMTVPKTDMSSSSAAFRADYIPGPVARGSSVVQSNSLAQISVVSNAYPVYNPIINMRLDTSGEKYIVSSVYVYRRTTRTAYWEQYNKDDWGMVVGDPVYLTLWPDNDSSGALIRLADLTNLVVNAIY